MTKLINSEEVPSSLRENMMRDIAIAISKKRLDGTSLQYYGDDGYLYLLYILKNKTGKMDEIFFRSNDIVMDYRNTKPQAFQVF